MTWWCEQLKCVEANFKLYFVCEHFPLRLGSYKININRYIDAIIVAQQAIPNGLNHSIQLIGFTSHKEYIAYENDAKTNAKTKTTIVKLK